jgi:hypothetical protein
MTNEQFVWKDESLSLTLLSFDPSTRQARLKVEERTANVGHYHLIVRFSSGDETRFVYDGANPYRVNQPVVTSNHLNDSVSAVTAIRLGG